jgi:hypothetical protein
MCYSGKCWWEDHMGDCRLWSHIQKKVKEKFGIEWLCELPECKEHEDYIHNNENFKQAQAYAKELYFNKNFEF